MLQKKCTSLKISILKIRQTLSNKHTNKDALEENLTRYNERKSSFKLEGWSYFLGNIKRNLLKTLDINCAYSFTNATATWMRLTKSLRPVLSTTGWRNEHRPLMGTTCVASLYPGRSGASHMFASRTGRGLYCRRRANMSTPCCVSGRQRPRMLSMSVWV